MVIDKRHKTINLFVTITLLFLIPACSLFRKAPAIEKYSFEIHFGSTGGFTNKNPEYIVKSNGDVLKKDISSPDFTLIKNVGKHKIDSLYILIEKSNFNNLKIKEISNLTNYIEIHSERWDNKVMWYNELQIPVELIQLYNSLIGATKK